MQYAICERIGTGQWVLNPTTREMELDAYRPVVADYGCSYVAVNKNDNRFFVKFEGGDEAGALADDRVIALNRPLTDVLTAIQANFVNNRLEARFGITSDPITAGMTVQQVLDVFLSLVDDTADFSSIKMNANT